MGTGKDETGDGFARSIGERILDTGGKFVPDRLLWELSSLLPVSNLGIPVTSDADVIEEGARSVDFMLDRIKQIDSDFDIEGKRILDIGCGSGRIAVPLAERGANVYGIDVSRGYLRQCRANAEAHNVDITLELVDGTIPDDWSEFSLVIAVRLFQSLKRRETIAYHHSAHQAIASDGLVYFTYPMLEHPVNQEQLFEIERDERHPFRNRYYTESEIRIILNQTGFTDIQLHKDKHNEAAVPQWTVVARPT